MKNDLATAIITAVIGVVASYFLAGLFFGEIEDFTISSVDPNLTVELADPNADIFNYRAVNPTVEVYVGECDDYDQSTGTCTDDEKNDTVPIDEESEEQNNNEESTDNSEPNSETENENEVEEDF